MRGPKTTARRAKGRRDQQNGSPLPLVAALQARPLAQNFQDRYGATCCIIRNAYFFHTHSFSKMVTKNDKNQNLTVEGLRGIAALLVVFNHLLFAVNGLGVKNLKLPLIKTLGMYAGHCGGFGVQVFFCITGYLFWKKVVVSGATTDWHRFYVNRVLRIAPAYGLFAVFLMIFGFYLSQWHINLIPSELAHDFFAASSLGLIEQHHFNGMDVTYVNAVVWTLGYEWLFYAVLPFAASLRLKRWTTVAGLAFLFAYLFAYELIRYPLLFFVTGAFVAEIRKSEAKAFPILGSAAFLIAFAIFLATPIESISKQAGAAYGSLYVGSVTRIAFVWLVVSVAFWIAIRTQPLILTCKPIRLIGVVSYSLYLMHLLVMQTILRLADIIKPVKDWTTSEHVIWMTIALGCVLAFSTFCYFIAERPFLSRKRNDQPRGFTQPQIT